MSPSPTPTPSATGAVSGIVWFDRNEDGDRDSGEWPLPGVTVRLEASSSTGTAGAQHATGLGTARAAAKTLVTAADGGYKFTGVQPGSYTVRASVVAKGFSYTSDTDGSADWSVGVRVAGAGVAKASFAGLGKGSLDGTVFFASTRTPISGAEVTCRWAGFDDVAGTADDVTMPTVANGAGSFDLTRIPYGGYSCVGRDPVGGEVSAAATVSVMSPVRSHAELPVRQGSPAVVSDGPLPTTGLPLVRLVVSAFGLILAGLVALRFGRRRRT